MPWSWSTIASHPGVRRTRIARPHCANGRENIIFATTCAKTPCPPMNSSCSTSGWRAGPRTSSGQAALPPDYELRAKSAALAREFRNNRDEARPIFTVEEQRDVDASRAAGSLRDRIEGHEDLGASLRQVSVQYAISNALGEFDARKRVSDRFGELYGRSRPDYAQEQRRGRPREAESTEMRVIPAELGWDKYEPAFHRWAAYNSMQYVARRDGAISAKEYAEREEYLDRWVADQRRQGKLPPEDEIRRKNVNAPRADVALSEVHHARGKAESAQRRRLLAPGRGFLGRDQGQHRHGAALYADAQGLRDRRGRGLRQVIGSGQRRTSRSGSRGATSTARPNITNSGWKAATASQQQNTEKAAGPDRPGEAEVPRRQRAAKRTTIAAGEGESAAWSTAAQSMQS